MEILVCVKRVPMVGGKIVRDRRRPGRGHPDVRVHGEPARGVRGRGGRPAGGAPRRQRDRAHARPARRRGSAARHAGARGLARGAAGDRRPGMGADRDRGGDRGRRPRLRPLRPAAVRQRGGRHRRLPGRRPGRARARPALRHRHQEPRGHRRRARGPGASTAAPRRSSTSRCPRWSRSRRASTCPGTRRCPGGCGPSGPRSSSPRREWHAEGLRKERLRVPAGETKRAEILGTGADAVPALVALLDELGVLP